MAATTLTQASHRTVKCLQCGNKDFYWYHDVPEGKDPEECTSRGPCPNGCDRYMVLVRDTEPVLSPNGFMYEHIPGTEGCHDEELVLNGHDDLEQVVSQQEQELESLRDIVKRLILKSMDEDDVWDLILQSLSRQQSS